MSARPNFFVGIRLSSPVFASAVVSIQGQVIQVAPHLHKCRMDSRKLHLTCFVMSLSGTEQINKAVECLTAYQEELNLLSRSLVKKEVTFKSIGNFTTKVLFASPEEDQTMQALTLANQQLEQRFVEAGLIANTPSNGRAWHPHATILKTSYDRKNGSKLKFKPEDYAGMEAHLQNQAYIGTSSIAEDDGCNIQAAEDEGLTVPLTSIDLLSMQEVQADGYYRSYAQILF